MAEIDWAEFATGHLDSSHVARGVSNAFARPNGGGNMAFGFRSLDALSVGSAGYYVNLANFIPFTGTKKGGVVSAAMKRYTAAAGYAPFIGIILDKDPTANGYFLCLTDGTSYRIGLKKGSPNGGFESGGSGMLRESTAGYTYSGDTEGWFHLKLEVLVNPHGEVILNVEQSDLAAHAVTAPSWAAVAGMGDYTDDSLGHLSGSAPYLQGFYAVMGMYVENTSGVLALFDQVIAERQTNP
uniref:Uncharacterized protein n=1 Tax=viral metagenome TaxID=1070528 RepID=A0A6H1Z7L9_9ZZZZ